MGAEPFVFCSLTAASRFALAYAGAGHAARGPTLRSSGCAPDSLILVTPGRAQRWTNCEFSRGCSFDPTLKR